MSIEAMKAVWDLSKVNGTELLVLLAIADNANDEGEAWPSIQTIARKSRISERQAKRLIGKLVDKKELVILPGTGRGHVSHYVISLIGVTVIMPGQDPERVTSGAKRVTSRVERVTSGAKKGDIQGKKGDIQGRAYKESEPSIEPSEEPSEEPGVRVEVPTALAEFHSTLLGTPGYDPSTFRPNFFEKVLQYQSVLDLDTVAITIADWVKEQRGKKPATEGRILSWLRRDYERLMAGRSGGHGTDKRGGSGGGVSRSGARDWPDQVSPTLAPLP